MIPSSNEATGMVEQFCVWLNHEEAPPPAESGVAADLYDIICSVAPIAAVIFAFSHVD